MTAPGQTMTILLVDDREENLVALEDMLEADNRVFLKATSGNDALRLALKHTADIGLIMLDVQMPGMDGFEVAHLLKSNAKTREISVIFVTALSKEEQYTLKGFDSGAVDYLHKPLDINVTKAKVRVFEQLYFYQQDLKRTIEEKNRINRQLERFNYVVAHDLKSPLSSMFSLMGLLRDDARLAQYEDISELLRHMADTSYDLTQMIESILDYSRKAITEVKEEVVNVQQIVSDIVRVLHPPAHISITIGSGLPVITAKRAKLRQVFQNLLSNAIKYIDKPEGRISIGYVGLTGDFHKFYVADNGPGIAEADHERIFRLFETSDNRSHTDDGSSGIGLNVLKVLVEEQGGKITVESKLDEGSTFYFLWHK